MVLGIRVTALPILALIACSPAKPALGSEEAAEASDDGFVGLQSAKVAGTEYQLVTLGRTCAIRFGEQQIVLKLPPPCRFISRGATGEATVENYGDAGSITLIAGPLAAASDYELSEDREPEDRCSHLAQPLIVKDGAAATGEVQVSALGFCSEAAPDEKYYYGLAHPAG